MADEKPKAGDGDKRKKIVIGLIAVVGAFLAWQVFGMFGGDDTPAPIRPVTPPKTAGAKTPAQQAAGGAEQATPQQMAKQLPMTAREMELLKLQQETQARYITTMNELQMLKLTLEVAETNKNIMAARLDTIKAQKGIVDLLTPEKKPSQADMRAQMLGSQSFDQIQSAQPQQSTQEPPPTVNEQPTPVPTAQAAPPPPPPEEVVPYTVVSVSKIENRWNAVVGVQGVLYSVHVGDIVPADGSKVKSISSSGIVLEKNDKERKVSLVPII